MSTRKDIEEALKNKVKTREELERLYGHFGFTPIRKPEWKTDEEFVNSNVNRLIDLVDFAIPKWQRKLCRYLDVPTLEEAQLEESRDGNTLAKKANELAWKANKKANWSLIVAIATAIIGTLVTLFR